MNTYQYVDTAGGIKDTTGDTPEAAMANAKDIAPNSGVKDITATPAIPTKPAVIVTSDQSRSLYNDNVGKMNEATTAIQNTNALTNAANAPKGSDKVATPAVPVPTDTTTKAPATETNFFETKYKEATKGLDESINSAKTSLEQMRLTLTNDPAAEAAVAQVMALYGKQIELMKEKNEMVRGNNVRNSARYGSLQYASEMNDNFLDDQQVRAQGRVMDLVNQMIAKANEVRQSYKEGNVKAFNEAQKAYETANKAKVEAINDMLKESERRVKEEQSAKKLMITEKKAALDEDIKVSANLGKTIVDELAAASIKDDAKKRKYVEQIAAKYGIDNVDILMNSVVKAEQEQARQDILNKNTASTIAKRNAPKTTGTKTAKAPAYTFEKKVSDSLVGAGNTKAAIDRLSQDIAVYGIKRVLEEGQMDEQTRQILRDKFE